MKHRMQQGTLSIREALDRYGDMPLCDFVDEALKHGLIPLNLQVTADELEACPQRTAIPTLSVQDWLAS